MPIGVTKGARFVAIVLLFLLGASGLLVGFELLGGVMSIDAGPAGTSSGLLFSAGIGGYGLALVLAALGLVVDRRWGWPLAVIGIAIGLPILLWVRTLTSSDEIVDGGLVVWAVTLGALVLARIPRSG